MPDAASAAAPLAQSCPACAAHSAGHGPNQIDTKTAIITEPLTSIACHASGARANPVATSIVSPDEATSATDTQTIAKKRFSTATQSASRSGGASAPAAGRRQAQAKAMPPTQTMTPSRCRNNIKW